MMIPVLLVYDADFYKKNIVSLISETFLNQNWRALGWGWFYWATDKTPRLDPGYSCTTCRHYSESPIKDALNKVTPLNNIDIPLSHNVCNFCL